jgi:putative ABC transport system permease protein
MTSIRLGFHELFSHIRLVLVMALAVAIPLTIYLTLQAYNAGMSAHYSTGSGDYLVVQSSGSLGEYFGSRLSAEVGDTLWVTGASLVIPEIHTVVGTTKGDAILLRGISLELVSQVEEYKMVAGRPLLPGDASRLAMIGARLAEFRHLLPGDTIPIRGRDFRVVGIFEVNTYADNEAWISLEDAQVLMGWGTDVSIYLIPSGESIEEGDVLPGDVSVVRKGASGTSFVAEWEPFFGLIDVVVGALGVSVAVALASILWRLAWLQRRELAILRSMGFGKGSLSVYLFTQGSGITLLGFLLGGLGGWSLGQFTKISTVGISIQAVFDVKVILASLAFAAGITLAGTAVPAWWLNRLNLSTLLRSE